MEEDSTMDLLAAQAPIWRRDNPKSDKERLCSTRSNVMRKFLALILVITLGLDSAAIAQSSLVAGQVVRVDQSAKKITIKHGPIPRLDIEESTIIVYAAPDSNML